jgi:CheY-like chemotaxis protein
LVVDDYEPWRVLSLRRQNQSNLLIIGEAGDGLEAVQIAQQQQPDLIVLDIGLPTLNGIEAAAESGRFPKSKILFVSDNRSGTSQKKLFVRVRAATWSKRQPLANYCPPWKQFYKISDLSVRA